MIDVKQSYRKGRTIVAVNVDETTGEVTRTNFVYPSINKAKFANRLTKYRTVPMKVQS